MPVFLHAACGPATKADVPINNFRDWDELRLDIDDQYNPDIVGDIRGGRWVGQYNERLDGVYCSHALEHLHLFDVPKALRSFFDVLKPNGFLCVFVPNFQAACRFVAEGREEKIYDAPCGPIYAQDIIFGHNMMSANNEHMRHRCGFTPALLRGLLLGAGFIVTDVRVDDLNIFMTGQKL